MKAAFDAGCSAYVLKSDSRENLIPAIQMIVDGQRFISHTLRDGPEAAGSTE
jgi:DNA-binding NarL/FixJ family response regulator